MNIRETHLQVKVINLADEAKTIRRKEREALRLASANWKKSDHFYRLYESLQSHRKGVVREAARRNHLALACVRGRAYAEVERSVRDRLQARFVIDSAYQIARRFGCSKENADAWKAAALKHLGYSEPSDQAA